jgi:hypothetical protein
MTNGVAYRRAAVEAAQLLALTPQTQDAHFAAPDEAVFHPDRTIRQALARAQFVLNTVCTVAVEGRLRSLQKIQRKQRLINLLHILTASGFAVLLTNHFEEPMKWIGAIVSAGAGAFALWLPSNIPDIERSVLEGTNTISTLSGTIARLEFELTMKKDQIGDELSEQIATALASCREQAVKWKFNQMATDTRVDLSSSLPSSGEQSLKPDKAELFPSTH